MLCFSIVFYLVLSAVNSLICFLLFAHFLVVVAYATMIFVDTSLLRIINYGTRRTCLFVCFLCMARLFSVKNSLDHACSTFYKSSRWCVTFDVFFVKNIEWFLTNSTLRTRSTYVSIVVFYDSNQICVRAYAFLCGKITVHISLLSSVWFAEEKKKMKIHHHLSRNWKYLFCWLERNNSMLCHRTVRFTKRIEKKMVMIQCWEEEFATFTIRTQAHTKNVEWTWDFLSATFYLHITDPE